MGFIKERREMELPLLIYTTVVFHVPGALSTKFEAVPGTS
jgi:hypothetical protein